MTKQQDLIKALQAIVGTKKATPKKDVKADLKAFMVDKGYSVVAEGKSPYTNKAGVTKQYETVKFSNGKTYAIGSWKSWVLSK
jgi:hypothetical protein